MNDYKNNKGMALLQEACMETGLTASEVKVLVLCDQIIHCGIDTDIFDLNMLKVYDCK